MQEKGRKKNQEKRIILAFLREEAGILLWVVFFIGIFWLLCFLEDIPQDVTIYTLQLASFTGIAVLIVRFIHYRKRCKTLELLTKDPRDKIEAFPNPDTLSEKLYRQIIGQYERELRKEEQQMDDRYREMVEYYTMWTTRSKRRSLPCTCYYRKKKHRFPKNYRENFFRWNSMCRWHYSICGWKG